MFPNRNKEFKNFTMVDNFLIEEVFPRLKSLAECKIILHIYRNTMGVVVGTDDEGKTRYREVYYITTRKLAEILQLSQKSIITGMHNLEKGGFIVKVNNEGKTGYRLRLEGEPLPTQES